MRGLELKERPRRRTKIEIGSANPEKAGSDLAFFVSLTVSISVSVSAIDSGKALGPNSLQTSKVRILSRVKLTEAEFGNFGSRLVRAKVEKETEIFNFPFPRNKPKPRFSSNLLIWNSLPLFFLFFILLLFMI